MMHLDFSDPTIKFFLNHTKNCIEILNLTIWWVGFCRSTPQSFPSMLALRGYIQNFYTSSQTHITDFFVNCNVQGVLCYPTYRNLWRWYEDLDLYGRYRVYVYVSCINSQSSFSLLFMSLCPWGRGVSQFYSFTVFLEVFHKRYKHPYICEQHNF